MRTYARVAILAVVLAAPPAVAQTVLYTKDGDAAGHELGTSLAAIGDVDHDGWGDLAVGEPGFSGPGTDAGRALVLSGRFLASGVGNEVLFSFTGAAAGDRFGACIAAVGDIDHDGFDDFAIGAPFSDLGGANKGSVRFYSGLNVGVIREVNGYHFTGGFGSSIAAVGDVDGDLYDDVLVGAPYADVGGTDVGAAHVLGGKLLSDGSASFMLRSHTGISNGERFGWAVAGGECLDLDSVPDYLISAPWRDATPVVHPGWVTAYSGMTGASLGTALGGSTESLGYALDFAGDYNGDGRSEVLIGGPFADTLVLDGGRVALYDGLSFTTGGAPVALKQWHGAAYGGYLGIAVAEIGDANGDGVGDFAGGAPFVDGFLTNANGRVHVWSGATGQELCSVLGAKGSRLGTSVCCAYDLDADGRSDFAAGAPFDDVGGTDTGELSIRSVFPVSAHAYCTAKVNSQGCTPSITFTGSASASSSAAFRIGASYLLNNKNGLLFYGYGMTALAFQGGHLCVKLPIVRTSVQATWGNPPPNDCSGSLTFDFNAYLQSGVDPSLVAGEEVFAQYWSRDPASPSTTNLTNALRFVVNP